MAAMVAADPFDLNGRVVLVTGGCRGIGVGITTRFLDAGAEVAICCRHEPDPPIAGTGGRTAVFFPADVRDPEQVDGLIGAIVERFGRLDVVVNNAGGSPSSDTATVSPRFVEGIVKLNLLGPLFVAQRVHDVMQAQDEGGSIINIASVSALRANPGAAAYGAAKAGLLNLTQTLAVEWGPKIRVNAVSAGYIRTEQSHLWYGDEAGIAAVGQTIPLRRMGDPADVADACLYLASPLARYVSGANLLVHGGGELPAYLQAANPTP